jgi:hypothetical protein
MTTPTTIVSSPNVNGNIGSCTTNVVEQRVSRDNFFIGTWQSIATNSCTGQVETHQYWQLTSDTAVAGAGLIIAIALAAILKIMFFD